MLNLEDRFSLHVIQNFVSEYSRGRTPIPCVRCNSFTKFRDLLAHADALDCAFIATGHYAVARDGGLYRGTATTGGPPTGPGPQLPQGGGGATNATGRGVAQRFLQQQPASARPTAERARADIK